MWGPLDYPQCSATNVGSRGDQLPKTQGFQNHRKKENQVWSSKCKKQCSALFTQRQCEHLDVCGKCHGDQHQATKPTPHADTQASQNLHNNIPEGWSYPAIATWMSASDDAIQASAKDIVRTLQTSKRSQEQLREAATRYGLPLARLNKAPLKTLQNLVSIGIALSC